MRLDVQQWTVLFRNGTAHQVLLNGKDVTRDCTYADDAEGLVRLLVREDDGTLRVDRRTGEPRMVDLRGTVEIKPMSREEWESAQPAG